MTQPMAVGPVATKGANKRLFVLVGVGVAVLLVTFVLPKLLFGGGGDDGGDALAVPVTVAPAATAPAPTTPTGAAPPPETIEVFTNKNPFTPLVDMTPAGPSAGPGVPAAGGTDVGTGGPAPAPSDPTATPVTAPPASTPSPAGTASTGPRPVQRVSLIDVSTAADGGARATVQVNDSLYEVAEGEEFAGSYRVVSLSDTEGCAQLLYGDDRFRVCEGEELLK